MNFSLNADPDHLETDGDKGPRNRVSSRTEGALHLLTPRNREQSSMSVGALHMQGLEKIKTMIS